MFGFVTSIVLAALVLVLYALMSAKPGMQKEYRDRLVGLADLLRYATPVDDGVMLGKGGELIAGFFYRGSDTESATNAELDAVVSRLNAAMNRLGNGWMVHIDAVRDTAIGYPGQGEFYAPVLRMIDEERRRQYNMEGAHFESQYAMVVTYQPPSRFESKARAMMVEQSEDLTRQSKTVHDQVLDRFKTVVDELQGQIASAVDGIERMRCVDVSTANGAVRNDVLMGYLHYCVTGIPQLVRAPDVGLYADTIIGSQDFTGGNTPKIGSKHIRVVSIEGFPSTSHAGILGMLNSLPVTYRWSTRFIFLEASEGLAFLEKMRKRWKQKVRGMKDQLLGTTTGAVDEHALNMTMDAQTAMSAAQSGVVRYGHYTSVVVLMHEDHERVDDAAKLALAQIQNMGFTGRIETWNAVEAYLGSLPGHGHENVRRPVLHTGNLAHLVPTTATWPGPMKNPCPFYPPDSPALAVAETTGNAPFRLNLHVNDVGHTLVIGPTGSGKSTLVEFLEAQHPRYAKARVIKFEKGYSSFILCNAADGAYYDIGSEHSSPAFCPLGRVDKPTERKWAEGYIEVLMELQGISMNPARRSTVRAALQLLAKSDPDRRTMTDFAAAVQDLELQEALAFYTLAGDNEILDAKTDSIAFSRFTVFEMEHLMNMGEKHTVPVLLYLFRCVERVLDGSPTMLTLDEAWLLLQHPMFSDKIKEWLKVLRKANCLVLFATQSISDVGNCSIRDVVYESCLTKILLPNTEAKSNKAANEQYRLIGLNERQIDLIAHAVPKQDYYYMSPMGKRMFRLGLGPMAMSMVGASGKEDIATARALMKEYGAKWLPEWLKHCAKTKVWGKGLMDWARFAAEELREAA